MQGKTIIKYFGNSAFQITTEGGKRVLIDPCLTGMDGRGVTRCKPEDIEAIDVIFVTHAAGDHLGDTYEIASRLKSPVVCDPAVNWYLNTRGLPKDKVKGSGWGMRSEVAGVRYQTVESKHISILRQPACLPISGCPNGYIIYTESGRGIYHPGDTAIFRDMELFAELYHPDIAMLGIGGFPGFPGELSPEEAALVAKWMNLKFVFPHHYQPGEPELQRFVTALAKTSPQTQAIVLGQGEEIQL